MPLYSDLGIYCAPHLTTPSYYSSPFLGPSARSTGTLGLGLMPMPRLFPSRVSPLLPSIPESVSGAWRGKLDRIPSPRYTGPRYTAPKPVRMDTADIDVSSARYAARKERELAAAGAFGEKDPRATIRRGRTVVRLHTQKQKENPSIETRRKMTPGERLVQKFLIRDKAEEAAKEAMRKKVEEKEEKERVSTEIAKLRAMEAKTAAIAATAAAAAEASGIKPEPAEPLSSSSAQDSFPTIQGLSENAALDILLSAEQEERKEQEDQQIEEEGNITRSTGTVKKRKHGEKDGTIKADKKKPKKNKEDASGSSSDVSLTDEEPIEKCNLQRRNTVRFRRNSHDVDGFFPEEEGFFPSSRRSSADLSPASRRSSIELSPMTARSHAEHSPASRRSSVDSSDDTPLASEKKSTVKRKKQKNKIVADVSVENAEPRSPKFIVDDVQVEESPTSAKKKFRYDVIVEDEEAEKAAGRKSDKENKAVAPKKKKDAGKVGKPLEERKNKAAPKATDATKNKAASKETEAKSKTGLKDAEIKNKVGLKDAETKNKTGLKDAEVKNKVGLKDTEVKNKVGLKDAEVKNKVDLKDAEVKNKVGLKDTEVKNKVDLKDAEVESKIGLKDAETKNKTGIKDAEVKNKVDLKDAEVKNKVGLKDEELKNKVDLKEAEVKKKTGLKEVEAKNKTGLNETKVSKVAQVKSTDPVQKSFQTLKPSAEPQVVPAVETSKVENKTEEKAKNLLEAIYSASSQRTEDAQPQYKDAKDKQKLEEKLDKLSEQKLQDVNKEKSAQAALKRKKIEEEIEETKMKIKDLQKGIFLPETGKPKVEAALVPKVEDVKVGKRVVEKTKQPKRQADPTPLLAPTPETEDSGVNFWAQLNGMNEEEYAPKKPIISRIQEEVKAEVKDEPKKKVKTKPPPLKLGISEGSLEEGETSSSPPQTAKRVTELKSKTEPPQVVSPKQTTPQVSKVTEEKPVPKWKQQLKQKATKEEDKKTESSLTTSKLVEPSADKAPSLETQRATDKATEIKTVPDVKKELEIDSKDTATTTQIAAVPKDEKQEKEKSTPPKTLKSEVPVPPTTDVTEKLHSGVAEVPKAALIEKQQKDETKSKATEPEKNKLERPKTLELAKPVEKPVEEKTVPKWKVDAKKAKNEQAKVPESPKEVSKKLTTEEKKIVVVPEKKPEELKPVEPPKSAAAAVAKVSREAEPQKASLEQVKPPETTEEKPAPKVKDFGKPLDAAKKPKDVSPSTEPSHAPKSPQTLKEKPQTTPEEKPVPKWKAAGKKQETDKKIPEPKAATPKVPEPPKEILSSVSTTHTDVTDGPKAPQQMETKPTEPVKPKEEEKSPPRITEAPAKDTATTEQKSPEAKPVPKWKVKAVQEKEAAQKKVPLGKTKPASDEKVPPSPTKPKPEDKPAEAKPTATELSKPAATEEKSEAKVKEPSKDAVAKKTPLGKAKQAAAEKTTAAMKVEVEAAAKVTPVSPKAAATAEAKADVSEAKKGTLVEAKKQEDQKPVEDKKPPKVAPKTAAEADKKKPAKKQPADKNKAAAKTPEITPKVPETEKPKPDVQKKTETVITSPKVEAEKKQSEPAGKAKGKAKPAEKSAEKGKPKVSGKGKEKPVEVDAEIKDAQKEKSKAKSTEVKDAKTKPVAKSKGKPAETKDTKSAEVKSKPAEVTVEIKDAAKVKTSAGKAKVLKKSGGQKAPPAPPPPASDADESGSSSEEESSSEDDGDATPRASTTSCSSSDSGFDSRPSSVPVPSTASSEGREPGSPALPLACQPAFDPYNEDGTLRPAALGRHTPPATSLPRFRKYTVDDFQFLKVLGKGSFGKVLLAELRDTERYYAVKCLKKDVVLEDDDVECTLIERKVLALGTKHPYLCHLFCTFQTESHLLFVMEYLNGGDLMFHIQQSGRFPEPRARFYGAEIVCGLKFLHKKGIVYRDLKLDNILLDFEGHVRIADFGMCKLQIFLDRTADTFCGTPDYMAPEIIKGLKYNQCVDWWSFGVLLFEMLVGVSPFSGCDEDELFWSICNEQPQYPRFLTREAHLVLTQLLEKDAIKRMGTPAGLAVDVCEATFFRSIDWGAVERRELEPPFRPRVKHALDTQYFDAAFTSEPARLTPIEMSILQSMDQAQFQGFSYTNPNATD